jgi:hypothetical protein
MRETIAKSSDSMASVTPVPRPQFATFWVHNSSPGRSQLRNYVDAFTVSSSAAAIDSRDLPDRRGLPCGPPSLLTALGSVFGVLLCLCSAKQLMFAQYYRAWCRRRKDTAVISHAGGGGAESMGGCLQVRAKIEEQLGVPRERQRLWFGGFSPIYLPPECYRSCAPDTALLTADTSALPSHRRGGVAGRTNVGTRTLGSIEGRERRCNKVTADPWGCGICPVLHEAARV